jgi:hypothetical protein
MPCDSFVASADRRRIGRPTDIVSARAGPEHD